MGYAQGRYCVNDLHKAAGGAEKDKPGNWIALDQTKTLERELLTAGNPAIKPIASKAGRYGGTFAVKELVYVYATWVSAAFHLKAIRAVGAEFSPMVAVTRLDLSKR